MTKILSIGSIYLDINAFEFPFEKGLLPEQELVGSDYEVVPGGSAFNFARVSAHLGLRPYFIGKIGKDQIGQSLVTLIEQTGVVPHLIESEQVKTNLGLNMTNSKGQSLMAIVGTANSSLSCQDIGDKAKEVLINNQINYFYLGGVYKQSNLVSAYQKLAEICQDQDTKIVLDHGRVTNKVDKFVIKKIRLLLPYISYYLPSEEELLKTWDSKQVSEAVAKVHQISECVVVVKKAEKGAEVFVKGQPSFKVPSFKVNVTNSIGAGDSFNAGLIASLEQDRSLKESVRFANATAAIMISSSGLPDLEEVMSLYQSK